MAFSPKIIVFSSSGIGVPQNPHFRNACIIDGAIASLSKSTSTSHVFQRSTSEEPPQQPTKAYNYLRRRITSHFLPESYTRLLAKHSEARQRTLPGVDDAETQQSKPARSTHRRGRAEVNRVPSMHQRLTSYDRDADEHLTSYKQDSKVGSTIQG